METIRIIVGCEFSQIVTQAFRNKGHEAFSCDLLPTEGNPQWHFQEDILEVLKREKFDLGIFHPPCTYLTRARGIIDKEKMEIARIFFFKLLNANIEKICVENPTPFKCANLPLPSQIIQPYYFGEKKSKRTLLWLKNLPPLMSVLITSPGEKYKCKGGRTISKWYSVNKKDRSRTFPGIAKAMSSQWGGA